MVYGRKRRYPSFRRKRFGRVRYRRRVGPRRSNFRRRARIPRSHCRSVFNNGGFFKFKFADSYSESFNVVGGRAFRLNSLYDPDYTGIGGTPSGVDTAARMYLRYEVLAAKVTVHWFPQNSSSYVEAGMIAGDQAYVASMPSTANAADSLLHEVRGPYCRSCVLPFTTAVFTKDRWTSMYVPIRKILGRRDNDCTAAFGNNPVTNALCYLMFYDRVKTNTSCTVSYDINITYYARCYTMNPTQWTQ